MNGGRDRGMEEGSRGKEKREMVGENAVLKRYVNRLQDEE